MSAKALTRWTVESEEPGCGECAGQVKAVEDADGEWVKWADVEAAQARFSGDSSFKENLLAVLNETFTPWTFDGSEPLVVDLLALMSRKPAEPTTEELQTALVACTAYFMGNRSYDYAITALKSLVAKHSPSA